MKMSDIRAVGYLPDQFKGKEPHTGRYVSAAKYIDQIAGVAGINVSDWKILEIFRNPESEKGYLLTDKNTINKVFFEHLENLKATAPVDYELPENIREKVTNESSQLSKAITNDYRDRITKLSLDIIAGEQMKWKNQSEQHQLYDAMEKYQDPSWVVKAMKEILSDPFFNFYDGDSGTSYYSFHTQPISLHHVNTAQAVNLTVPMGEFWIKLHWNPLKIEVHTWDNNLSFRCHSGSTYFHPHVASDHSVCFGTMLADYQAAVAKRDIVTMLKLTKTCLEKYYPSNPYAHLHSFSEAYERLHADGKKKPAEETDEEPSEDEASEEPLAASALAAATSLTSPGSINYRSLSDFSVIPSALRFDGSDLIAATRRGV